MMLFMPRIAFWHCVGACQPLEKNGAMEFRVIGNEVVLTRIYKIKSINTKETQIAPPFWKLLEMAAGGG